MKKNSINYIVIFISLAVLVFTFFLPKLMVQPGKLINAHSYLESNCFACHTTFTGISPQKCISCHKVNEIGLKTTKGIIITNENKNITFHQELTEGDCLSCHSDHRGVMAFRPVSQFSHTLLEQNTLNDCNKCHSSPSDNLHSNLTGNCFECHTVNAWTPSTFDHDIFFKNNVQAQNQCSKCHNVPSDALHSNFTGSCMDCHTVKAWIPSTFKHDKYFKFDRDHKTECAICHVNKNFKKFTCYGCHEHSRSNIREEHIEEGIYNYENCTECHRSSNEHEAKRIWRNNYNKKSINNLNTKKYRHDNDDDD